MQVYGQLQNATLEVLGSDPSTAVQGRIWFNSATSKFMLDDGTNKLALLRSDVNSNASANNFIEGYTTTATAAGTTTLTVASSYSQRFTGSTTQTVVLPDCTTLVLGQQFYITNRSTGVVTVNANGGGLIKSMATDSSVVLTCTSIATAAGTWDVSYATNAGAANALTTLGDLVVAGTGGAPQRLAIGVNGQYPCADSTATNGVSWQNMHNFRNHLVNGGFDYWQAGTTATITDTGGGTPNIVTAYLADQWFASNKLGGGTIEGILTYSQVTGVTDGSIFGASLKVTTAPTGTGIQGGIIMGQMLSARASYAFYNKTASFSVLVKALGNITSVNLIPIYNTTEAVAGHTSYGTTITVNVNSSTFTAVTLNGVAMGTAQSTTGVVGFKITPQTVSSGNLYDLNNGFVLEQGVMNLGPVAMPFARQYSDPAAELKSCQYFYQKSYDLTVAPGSASTSGMALGQVYTTASHLGFTFFYEPKRIAPTFATTNFWDAAGNNARASTWTVGGFAKTDNQNVITGSFVAGQSSCYVDLNVSTAQAYGVHWVADARM